MKASALKTSCMFRTMYHLQLQNTDRPLVHLPTANQTDSVIMLSGLNDGEKNKLLLERQL